jgi:hypothetical protein
VCGQVLPAIQHSKNHAYYIPRKLVKMFFSTDYRLSKSATSAVGRIENIWWGFFRQVEYALHYASEKETSRSKAIGSMAPSLALVARFDRGDFSHCISAGKHIRRVVACGTWEVADRRAERAGFIAFLFFTMGCLAALERVALAMAG